MSWPLIMLTTPLDRINTMANTLLDYQELLRNLPMPDVKSMTKSGHPVIPQWMAMDEVKRRMEMQKAAEAESAEQKMGQRPMVEEYFNMAQSLEGQPSDFSMGSPQGQPPMASPTDMMGPPDTMGPPQGFQEGGRVPSVGEVAKSFTPEEMRELYARQQRYKRRAWEPEGLYPGANPPWKEYHRQIRQAEDTFLPEETFLQSIDPYNIFGSYDPGEYVEGLQKTAASEAGPEKEHALGQLERMASTFRSVTPYEEWGPKRQSLIDEMEREKRLQDVPSSYYATSAVMAKTEDKIKAEKAKAKADQDRARIDVEIAKGLGERERVGGEGGENMRKLLSELDLLKKDIPSRRDDLARGVMKAGFATMAGESPHAGVNIGRGMAAGLDEYTGTRNLREEQLRDIAKLRQQVESTEAYRDVGTYKTPQPPISFEKYVDLKGLIGASPAEIQAAMLEWQRTIARFGYGQRQPIFAPGYGTPRFPSAGRINPSGALELNKGQ